MGCYIEFLILKEKILEIAGEEISMPVTVGDTRYDNYIAQKINERRLSSIEIIL